VEQPYAVGGIVLMNSAYSLFKRPSTLDNAEPFLESCFERFQGRCHYTPNLAQEINPSRNQRRINVDRVSISGGGAFLNAGIRGTVRGPETPSDTRRPREAVVNGRATSNADSYSRCFRYKRLIRQAAGLNKPVLVELYPRGALSNSLGRLSNEYRGDNVPHSPYQPHSGSYPAGSCGQKVSSRALITALQTSKGSGVKRDEMT